MQNELDAAKQLLANAKQAKVDAEQNALVANRKTTAAEAKLEVAELRATTAEDKVKALEEQMKLSGEATERARAREADAVQQSKKAVDQANETSKSVEKSRKLFEQTQRQLLINTAAVTDKVNELKATVAKQAEELARMSRLQDELAETKADRDREKFSCDEWEQASNVRDEQISQLKERIVALEGLLEAKDKLLRDG